MFHQTRKTYNTIEFVRKVIEWRGSLSTFFEYVTGHKTRAFQEDFFKEIESFEKRNIGIVAGRGIGKTHALAVVALWYLLVFAIAENKPIKVIILGGSLKQAKICYGYIMEAINKIPYLENQLAKEPTQDEIHFKDGSWVMPLPASEKSVRGNHPDILIVDEAAQVENSIIYAALPMTATSKYARHIFSTTPGSGYSFIEEQWEKRKRLSQDWVFLNWDAELCLPPDHLRMLKEMMSEDAYQTEIKGIPYRLEGKVFRIEDMKLCQKSDITYQRVEGLSVYAGVDWGYFPAPTVLIIVQQRKDEWEILYMRDFLKEDPGKVQDDIKETCLTYGVNMIFTDSTDKGENARLMTTGLPVQPITFKGEKSIMITNLRMLIEKHKLFWDSMKHQPLIQQLLDYTYNSKRNDDYVDALMLAVHENDMGKGSFATDIEEFFKAGISRNEFNSEVHTKRRQTLRSSGRLG